MDPVSPTQPTQETQPAQEAPVSTPEQPVVAKGGISSLLKKKWVIALVALVVLLVVLTVGYMVSRNSATKTVPGSQSTSISSAPVPTVSVEMKKALDEAKQSAQEYDNRQAELRTDYPWLRKLPFASSKYYVYFDLEKKVFIGKLYPATGDDTEQMKTDILNQLKVDKGIPVGNYKFEWIVTPK